MQTTFIDPADLSRLVQFFDILAAVVFAVSRRTLSGACTYVGLNGLGLARLPAMTAGFLVTFGVPGLAIRFGWSLPVFRGSATRERCKNERKVPAGEA